MQVTHVADAIASLEKANAELEPELLSASGAREMLALYARAKKLAAFGETALTRKIDDASEVARVTGTSVGKAKATVDTAKALRTADAVSDAFAGGEISLDQATEIARAEQARPGSASELLSVANDAAFHVLKEKSRTIVLEVEKTRGLAERQREARSARNRTDDLGMIEVNLRFEPHVGTPIVNRAEAVADRLQRKAKREGRPEPRARHLADAYASMLTDGGGVPAKRPELVVLVSHEVAKRGWRDVRRDEVCKIPGVGPIAPEVAREIADDAFLTGVFFDGKDLRHMRRWTRNTPVEVRVALELGEPPGFDGVRCVDCGNRFRNQNDHDEPHTAGGPASTDNLKPRCWSCHQEKTARDRTAGRLKAPGKRGPPGP